MSEPLATDEQPTRGRQARSDAGRAETQGAERRRRRAGTLNRMVQYRLQIVDPAVLDHENFVYRWFNDEGNNILRFTKYDDYDFVTAEDLGEDFDPSGISTESDARVRQLVGTKPDGSPLYAYLCRKPREYWDADYDEVVRAREDMMAGRVFHAEATDSDEARPGGADKFYASQGNQIGHAAERRRGPVPRKL